MHYMDSSALVKIYVEEAGSVWVRNVRERAAMGQIAICEISGAEVFAAFHRRFRSGDLSKEELQNACDLFRIDFDGFFVRRPVAKHIVDLGMRLIQKHPLRGYDSIQLATAISFLEELRKLDGEFLLFVGADKVLNTSAMGEGLTVINPADYE